MELSRTIRFLPMTLNGSDTSATAAVENRISSTSAVSDEVLFIQISADQGEALSILFQRYSGIVHRVAHRILEDATEAEDLVQDLFLFIQRKCRMFDCTKSSARSWIVQMTYHRAIERRRYLTVRQFYTRSKNDVELQNVAGSPTDESDYSPEVVFGRNGLNKVIDEMSLDQRETLRLYFFEGYTLTEIGEKLGQPLGNVRHYYYRGLDKLRKEMFRSSVRES